MRPQTQPWRFQDPAICEDAYNDGWRDGRDGLLFSPPATKDRVVIWFYGRGYDAAHPEGRIFAEPEDFPPFSDPDGSTKKENT